MPTAINATHNAPEESTALSASRGVRRFRLAGWRCVCLGFAGQGQALRGGRAAGFSAPCHRGAACHMSCVAISVAAVRDRFQSGLCPGSLRFRSAPIAFCRTDSLPVPAPVRPRLIHKMLAPAVLAKATPPGSRPRRHRNSYVCHMIWRRMANRSTTGCGNMRKGLPTRRALIATDMSVALADKGPGERAPKIGEPSSGADPAASISAIAGGTRAGRLVYASCCAAQAGRVGCPRNWPRRCATRTICSARGVSARGCLWRHSGCL